MHRFRFFSQRHKTRCAWRLWALWCLLPMLFLSIAGNVPHEHELRVLSALVQKTPSPRADAALEKGAPQRGPQGEARSSLFGAVAHSGDELCLLCQWASIAGAWLCVALAISWAFEGAIARFGFFLVERSGVARTFGARAPPV